MSSPTPRRRHSRAVYRRRRLVLLLALLAIAAAVWLLIAQPWALGDATPVPASSSSTAAPSATATADPTDAASADATTDATTTDAAASADPSASPELAACTASDVTVEAVTDQTTYASGQNPQFSIRLTNTSGSDCTMNVGTSTQSFTVTSGADTYWRSTDCQSESSDQYVTLAAGQEVTSATPITWDRTRSSVDTCDDANRTAATAGGASYHLAVSIGGVSSASTAQFLLY